MTLTIELTPEQEARLAQKAEELGVDAEELARKLIEGFSLQEADARVDLLVFNYLYVDAQDEETEHQWRQLMETEEGQRLFARFQARFMQRVEQARKDNIRIPGGVYFNKEGKERGRGFRDWAENHERGKPLLSDEAIRREAIYGARG